MACPWLAPEAVEWIAAQLWKLLLFGMGLDYQTNPPNLDCKTLLNHVKPLHMRLFCFLLRITKGSHSTAWESEAM